MLALFLIFFVSVSAIAQPQMIWNTPFGGTVAIWSPDGSQIASVGDAGITVVDVATSKRKCDILTYPRQYFYTADGSHLVMSTNDTGAVSSFNTTTGGLTNRLKYQDTTIKSLVVSRDRGRACAWYNNHVVVVFDVETLDSVMSLSFDSLLHVAISGDGSRISCTFAGSEGRNVSIYNVGERLPRMSVGAGDQISALNQAGDIVVTATQNGLLTSWDAKTGNKIDQIYWSFDLAGGFGIRQLYVAPSNAHMIAVGDAQAAIYELSELRYKKKIQHNLDGQFHFDADGQYLWSFGKTTGGVLYSFASNNVEFSIEAERFENNAATLSPDASALALVRSDNTLRTLTIATNDTLIIFDRVEPAYHATRPNIDRIVVLESDPISTLDLSAGEVVGGFENNWRWYPFNVTDREIWLVRGDSIEIRTIPNGEVVSSLALTPLYSSQMISFPDDDHVICFVRDSTMRKVNIRTGEIVWSLPREKAIDPSYYTISPSGKLLAVRQPASPEVKIIDADRGTLIRSINAAQGSTSWSFILHPDDKRLIVSTGFGDNALRVWDIESGDSLQVLRGHKDATLSSVLYPDGAHVATYSRDSTICLWNIDSGELLVKRSLILPYFYSDNMMVDPQGELLVVNTDQLWNANTLEYITSFPGWNARSFDATGSKIVVTRGSSSIGVIDILPYVLSSVQSPNTIRDARQIHLTANPNPIESSSTIIVRFNSTTDQTLQLSDLTGRVLLTLSGTGTLEPQHFTIERELLPSAGLHYLTASDTTTNTTILLLAF